MRYGSYPGSWSYQQPATILRPSLPPSPRQMEVLHALAAGATMRQAGHQLGISKGRASNLAQIGYHRLGTNHLIGALIELGWLEVPE